jgi:carbamate kinase
LTSISVDDLEALAAEGAFASGSMEPKVAAVCRFVRRSGQSAAITSLSKIARALTGEAGTIVQPAEDRPAEYGSAEHRSVHGGVIDA